MANRKFCNGTGQQLFFVYLLTNNVNGRKYVGYSEDPETRWEVERKDAYRIPTLKVYNSPLSTDIRKFGWENFNKEIILASTNQLHALNAERLCIEQYKTYIHKYGEEYGYNQTAGGKAPPLLSGSDHPNFGKKYGAHITDPKPQKEKIPSEELSRRISNGLRNSNLYANKDFSVSKETRAKISVANKGRKRSVEQIRDQILFSYEQEQFICQSYLNYTTIVDLTREYDCSDTAIKNCLKRNNIVLRQTKPGRKKIRY